MQFHLNGFRPGNPDIPEPAATYEPWSGTDPLPETVDVLIVGCGPAGLTLAAQLAAFPDITTRIVEQKPGPLRLGQADGIACRTMEMFEAFGFCERVLREAHWIVETTFWRPDGVDADRVVRHGRVQDVEDGLSERPHVVLNQARVHDFYLEVMRNAPSRLEPSYGRRLTGLTIDPAAGSAGRRGHPVTVTLERLDPGHEGQTETVRARCVVGCDGARSTVRQSLGRALAGDSANQAWGVMDVLAVTDFPDIRLKSFIQSAGEGTIVLIPREGGYLVRIYVEIDKLSADERVASRNVTVDHLIAATKRIMRPYFFEAKEVPWWSVYEIGQRLCDRFDDVPAAAVETRVPCVFIAGDACHTHSPKAGQGMNVSMQDTFNLGWKLAAVLRGQCSPRLLSTYSAERQAVAKELIDFDREWAAMLSAPHEEVDPAEVQRYFVRHGRYTAGTATRYAPSLIIGGGAHQHLAAGLPIGMRFHSAPVVRVADARTVELGHVASADGRWRIYAFAGAGDPTAPSSDIRAFGEFLLDAAASPVRRYTPAGADVDAVIDVRVVLQHGHRDIDLAAMPVFVLPRKGRYGLRDYEKLYCAGPSDAPDVFALRGIDRANGCLVVVRPDQYVAHVLPLNGFAELSAFFDGFMLPANG